MIPPTNCPFCNSSLTKLYNKLYCENLPCEKRFQYFQTEINAFFYYHNFDCLVHFENNFVHAFSLNSIDEFSFSINNINEILSQLNLIPGRIFFNTNYIFVYQDIDNPASFQFEHLDELFEKLNFIATFI